ncbi:hypothetical protein NITLEN_30414 [Nitrospira lenta]|uniref:Uncharacterized protein n=1 Tax=Nitrospira lenta TaxID=1436998 RepID=A0A330LET9_9BACT|nr:hypothetical protein NITLEN_30414 [Nitrospira lenta]
MPDQKDLLPLRKDSTGHCILEEISYSAHKPGQQNSSQHHNSMEQFILLRELRATRMFSPMNS